MKTKLWRILKRIHLISLTIVILNSLVKFFTPYSLEGNIELSAELLMIISGVMLFFFYINPFKKMGLYFLIYAVMSICLMFGIVFRGIVGAIVLSIIFYPFYPDQKKIEHENIIISIPFKGFMAPCCSYQVKKRTFLVFEKNYGTFEEEPIDFESINIERFHDEFELTYSTDFEKRIRKKKTIQL